MAHKIEAFVAVILAAMVVLLAWQSSLVDDRIESLNRLAGRLPSVVTGKPDGCACVPDCRCCDCGVKDAE